MSDYSLFSDDYYLNMNLATEMEMPVPTEADFGQTLYTWGVSEGAYGEIPIVGPATNRRAAGMLVDLFTNPLSYVLPDPEKYYGTGASIASRLSDRGRYSDTVDSILYESADSYSQLQSLYYQNRRFRLGKGGSGSYVDPYSDPYEDPYDE